MKHLFTHFTYFKRTSNYFWACLLTCMIFGSTALAQAPVNDDCTGALTLPLGSNTCGAFVSATNVNATTSAQLFGGFCGGIQGGDVWFTLTMPVSGQVSVDHRFTGWSSAAFEVYTGTCAGLNYLGCLDFNNVAPGIPFQLNLASGTVVYIRVWDFGNNNTGTVELCAAELIPPANDDCANAQVLTQGAGCSPTQGTVANATAAAANCIGTGNRDVWYSFVATSTNPVIDVDANFDAVVQLYSGGCAGTSLVCSDPEYIAATGLTIGTTYHIRVSPFAAGNPLNGDFTICVKDLPGAPVNDACANATVLTHNTYCNPTPGTLEGSTSSGPGCASPGTYDVWYSFVAQSTTPIIQLNSDFDSEINLYSGTCGTLNSINCTVSKTIFTSTVGGLTVGNTYFIKVTYRNIGFPADPTFDICVFENPTCVSDRAMQPFCTDATLTYPAGSFPSGVPPLSASTVNPGNNYGCLLSTPNPAWFYLEIDQPGNIDVIMTNTQNVDVDIAMWGPFANKAAALTACGTYGAPLDCDYTTSPGGTMNIVGATTGQVYVILVTNFSNVATQVNIVSGGASTGTTNCNIICDDARFNYAPAGVTSVAPNYCDQNGNWNDYYTNNLPTELVFSIENLNATNDGTSADIITNNFPATAGGVYQSTAGGGCAPLCFEMARAWNVNLVGALPVGGANVRFYYDPIELTQLTAQANAYLAANAACGYISTGPIWFKTNGIPYTPQAFNALPGGYTQLAPVNGTTANGINYVQFNGVTGFSGGTCAICLTSPLPVELVNFFGTAIGEKHLLTWISANEQGSDKFVLEHAGSDLDFNPIAEVKALGNTEQETSYEVKNDELLVGSNFYRLKSYDQSGAYELSSTVELVYQPEVNAKLYPNPASNALQVEFIRIQHNATLELYSLDGRKMLSSSFTAPINSTQTVDIQKLPAGVYTYKLQVDGLQAQRGKL
ncbi:MAG: T9SS type A sorting domain-containing protein, partial [Bacteroidota bacterium]